jgi:uncharacterized repeat protein (TIGR01451 family)
VDDNDNDSQISPGDKIKYTIVVSNVGQQDIPTGGVTIKDTLDSDVSYVPNSIKYEVPERGESAIISGSTFPLDGDGLASKFPFLKRGGTAEISYEVTINDVVSSNKDTLVNEGSITFGTENAPVQFRTALRLAPGPAAAASIHIEKTVYTGHCTESQCNGSELLTGAMDDEVTFCFEVTNSGSANLASVEVKDPELNFDNASIGTLAPGETKTVIMQSSIKGEQMSVAEVTGIPVSPGTQDPLPGTSMVQDVDDAGVEIIVGAEEAEFLCE